MHHAPYITPCGVVSIAFSLYTLSLTESNLDARDRDRSIQVDYEWVNSRGGCSHKHRVHRNVVDGERSPGGLNRWVGIGELGVGDLIYMPVGVI